MLTHNVNLTKELETRIMAKVQSGHYGNACEVVQAALQSLERDEKDNESKLSALRAAIDEGDASGLAEGNPFARIRAASQIPGPTS